MTKIGKSRRKSNNFTFAFLSLRTRGASGTVGLRPAVPSYLGVRAVWETKQTPETITETPTNPGSPRAGAGIGSLGDFFAGFESSQGWKIYVAKSI